MSLGRLRVVVPAARTRPEARPDTVGDSNGFPVFAIGPDVRRPSCDEPSHVRPGFQIFALELLVRGLLDAGTPEMARTGAAGTVRYAPCSLPPGGSLRCQP